MNEIILSEKQAPDVYRRLLKHFWKEEARGLYQPVKEQALKLTPVAAEILEKILTVDDRESEIFLRTLWSRKTRKVTTFNQAFRYAYFTSAKMTIVSFNRENPKTSERRTAPDYIPAPLTLVFNPNISETWKRRMAEMGYCRPEIIASDPGPQMSLAHVNPDIPASRKPRPAPIKVCEP